MPVGSSRLGAAVAPWFTRFLIFSTAESTLYVPSDLRWLPGSGQWPLSMGSLQLLQTCLSNQSWENHQLNKIPIPSQTRLVPQNEDGTSSAPTCYTTIVWCKTIVFPGFLQSGDNHLKAIGHPIMLWTKSGYLSHQPIQPLVPSEIPSIWENVTLFLFLPWRSAGCPSCQSPVLRFVM